MKLDINGLRVVYGNKRNGQRREFYLDYNDECVAATCCTCGTVKVTSEFSKATKKTYGINSRCKSCDKTRKNHTVYVPIDFSFKIKKYVKDNKIGIYTISFGKQKNGYKRVCVHNEDYRPIAFSCCGCLNILPLSSFGRETSNYSSYGFSGECRACSIKRKRYRYIKTNCKKSQNVIDSNNIR